MSIAKSVRIMLRTVADGVSDQFIFDLSVDPYWVGSMSPGGGGGHIHNWMVTDITDVRAVSGGSDANLAGDGSTIIALTVPVKPAGEIHEIVLDVMFA
jgi:hypothetical protein